MQFGPPRVKAGTDLKSMGHRPARFNVRAGLYQSTSAGEYAVDLEINKTQNEVNRFGASLRPLTVCRIYQIREVFTRDKGGLATFLFDWKLSGCGSE